MNVELTTLPCLIQGVGDQMTISQHAAEKKHPLSFHNLKIVNNAKMELVKTKFISLWRGFEAKVRFLDLIDTKTIISVAKMTDNLQFRSQLLASQSLRLVLSLLP